MALITDLDDRTLVEQHRAGNPDAFRRIVERHHRSLYANALRRLGDPVAAEDAVQDAFLRAFRNIERFDGDYHLDAWLHRIVTNTCHDIGRRRGRDTRLFDRACTEVEVEVAPADEALDAMPREQITDALDSLPASYREVLVLRFVDELSYADVAEQAGISEENARARVSRGRTMLKRMLTSTSALVVWAIPPLRRQAQLSGAEAEAANQAAAQVHGLATIAASAPAPTHAFSQVSGIIAQAGPAIATAVPAVSSTAPTFGKAAVAVGLAAAAVIPAGVAVDRARDTPKEAVTDQSNDSSAQEAPGAPVVAGSAPKAGAAPSPSTSVVAEIGALGAGEEALVGTLDPSTSTTSAPSTTAAPSTSAPSTSTPPATDGGSAPAAPAPAPAPAPAEEQPPPPPAPVQAPPGQLSASVTVTQAGDRLDLSGPLTLEAGGESLTGQLSGKLHLVEGGAKSQGQVKVYRSDLKITLTDGRIFDLTVEGDSVVTPQGNGERHELTLRYMLTGADQLDLADSGTIEGTFVHHGDTADLGWAIPGATQEP